MTSEVELVSHRSTFPVLSSRMWRWLHIGQHRVLSPQEDLLDTQIMHYKVSAQNLRKENRVSTVQRAPKDLSMTLALKDLTFT